MDSAIWGLIGTAVGALASIGTTWLSNFSSHKLQESKAIADRAEQTHAFQRGTLLDLQEAIHDALRLIARAYLEDRKAHAAGKEWGKSNLSDEVNEGIRLAQRRVAILVERVSDDPLRDAVKATMKTATDMLFANSHEEAERRFADVTSAATLNLEQLGTVLRSHS